MASRPSRGGVDRNRCAPVPPDSCRKSPLAWGRGSKPLHAPAAAQIVGRPSRGGVDRNSCASGNQPARRRPSRGGVDRNCCTPTATAAHASSPLAWGRGSKPLCPRAVSRQQVAPRVGAWIETPSCSTSTTGLGSRPSRGGVDRNFFGDEDRILIRKSPLAWGRGSKRCYRYIVLAPASRPSRGGVDRNDDSTPDTHVTRPSRGGVDRNTTVTDLLRNRRRPSRGGVDRNILNKPGRSSQGPVAPRVGAWIETRSATECPACRPSRGGVDRNLPCHGIGRIVTGILVAPRVGAWIETEFRRKGRPSRGGVDRNCHKAWMRLQIVAPRVGAWIETLRAAGIIDRRRRPSRGGVDRNLRSRARPTTLKGRPSRGGVDRN